jgi:hypothetical protein
LFICIGVTCLLVISIVDATSFISAPKATHKEENIKKKHLLVFGPGQVTRLHFILS